MWYCFNDALVFKSFFFERGLERTYPDGLEPRRSRWTRECPTRYQHKAAGPCIEVLEVDRRMQDFDGRQCWDGYLGEIGILNQCGWNSQSYQSCDWWGQFFHQYLPFEDLDTQSRSLPEMRTENRPYWLHPWELQLGSRRAPVVSRQAQPEYWQALVFCFDPDFQGRETP